MAALPVVPLSSNKGLFTDVLSHGRSNSPVIAGAVLVGTTSIQLVPQNLARRGLMLINPGAVGLWVCPACDNLGNLVAAGGAGSLLLTPGQWISFGPETACGVAWNVAAAGGTNNPASAWEFL